MKDITVSQLIAYVKALPTEGVAIEQAFKYAFAPNVTAIAVAKDAALCYKTDALMQRIFELRIEVARLPGTNSFNSGLEMQSNYLETTQKCDANFIGAMSQRNASGLLEGFLAL